VDAKLRDANPTQALASRLRAGEIREYNIQLAALLGHEPSQQIVNVGADIFRAANRAGRRERCLIAADALDQNMPDWVVREINHTQWMMLCKDLLWEDREGMRLVFRCVDGLRQFTVATPAENVMRDGEHITVDQIRLAIHKQRLYPCLPSVKKLLMGVIRSESLTPFPSHELIHPGAISIQESYLGRNHLTPDYFLRIVDVQSQINFDRSIGVLLS
jgi:hypothetical protein